MTREEALLILLKLSDDKTDLLQVFDDEGGAVCGEIIKEQDAIIMAIEALKEPKQGEWIDTGYGTWRCSVCGAEKRQTYCMDKPRDRYCLWCGASMRKEGEEE